MIPQRAASFNVHDASCLREGSYWQLGDEPLLDASITFVSRQVVSGLTPSSPSEAGRTDGVDAGGWAALRRTDDVVLLRISAPRRDVFGRPGSRRITAFVAAGIEAMPDAWVDRVLAVVETDGVLDHAALDRLGSAGSAGFPPAALAGGVPPEVRAATAGLAVGDAAAWRSDARTRAVSRLPTQRQVGSPAVPEAIGRIAIGHGAPKSLAASTPVTSSAVHHRPLVVAALAGMLIGMAIMAVLRGSVHGGDVPRPPLSENHAVRFEGGWVVLYGSAEPMPKEYRSPSLEQLRPGDRRKDLLNSLLREWNALQRPLDEGNGARPRSADRPSSDALRVMPGDKPPSR